MTTNGDGEPAEQAPEDPVAGDSVPAVRPVHRLQRRRSLLAAGAGVAGLVVGAGATEAGDRLTASPPPPPRPALPATEGLMSDHGMFQRILLIYRECSHRLTTADHLDPAPLFHAAQIVHDYVEGFHEGIEEGYIFPRLHRAGKLVDTVRTLLVQHGRGRRLTVAIIADSTTMSMGGMASPGFATAASRRRLAGMLDAFVRMYEPHESREDTVIFPAFRDVTSDKEFTRVSERVLEAQHAHYGAHGFTRLVEQVARIEKQLGINDLGQFTPELPDRG